MKSGENQAGFGPPGLDGPLRDHAAFDRRAIPSAAAETRWALPDGHVLRRIDWPASKSPGAEPRGSLLFMPGRGDAYEKYLETMAHWAGRGWHVTAADWRGQAGSGRLGADQVTGHIADFALWVADLSALWRAWRAQTPGPHVLIGHSMGGHLVLRALAEGRVDPDTVVLSAPMLDFAGPPLPGWLLHGAARLMAAIGDRRRPAWKWSEKPGQLPAGRGDLLTHDAERYADELWWRQNRPELVMGPGSWGWTERAYASMRGLMRPGVLERVDTPVLLIGAERDRLVSFRAIERAAQRLPRGELLRFGEEAYHEVLRESDPVRDRVLAGIDAFLDRTAPVPRAL
jgi:lysophospholipase